jgi:hypothetical protein
MITKKERKHKTDGTKCWCKPKIESFKPKKYTVKEVFKETYWKKDNYWFRIVSTINGEEIKIPLHRIINDNYTKELD